MSLLTHLEVLFKTRPRLYAYIPGVEKGCDKKAS
jgi:hypothetical protein